MKKFLYLLLVVTSISLLLLGCSKGNKKEDESEKGGSSLESIEGVWEGVIQIPNQPLPIHIQFSKDGGTLSIPVQGLNQHPFAKAKLSDSNLSLATELQGKHITFDGKVDNEKISGTFKQQGQSFPFELKKGTAEASKEVGDPVQMEVEGGTMKGLLTTPQGEGPFPIMIIIAGSGPTDRDGNTTILPGKNNGLKMLAEDLAANGVASIRYDKRGLGQNLDIGVKEVDLRFEHFIHDVESWVQFVKKDSRFSRVGIIGHSEGSLIGMIAADKTDVDTYISISGAGRPMDEVLREQLAQLPASQLQESEDILDKLKHGEQVKSVSSDLQFLFRPSIQPYLISWLKYNPQEQLKKLDVPVFIINGTNDLQVPVKEAEFLHKAQPNSELYIIEGMNHVLKDAPQDPEGNNATYTNPDLPLSDGLVEHIIEFLEKNKVL